MVRMGDGGIGMKNVATAAVAASIFLAGCAGREPVPISVYKPSDAKLSCAELANEIQSNNANMLVRARESSDTTDRNVLIGAAGVLLFVPILLAIDAKDAAGTENRSYDERNRYLAGQARQAGCQVPTPLTVAMAEKQVEQAKKENTADGAPTQTATSAQPSGTSPAYAQSPGGSDLKNLMGRFLRGEITREQYEQERMQLASN